ncbi:MAG: GerW family sporulation protein [Clostridia bacterium]|nr:GerW family sporulation protein [Clostridia bacterium]
MSENKVNGLLETTIEKIKGMADVNTVIGDQITTPDGTTIIPISRVNYGFAAGGSDLPSKTPGLFGGGSGAAVTITPIAFLAVSNGNVRLIQVEPFTSSIDRAIQSAPDVVDKITGFISGLKDKKNEEVEKTSESEGDING